MLYINYFSFIPAGTAPAPRHAPPTSGKANSLHAGIASGDRGTRDSDRGIFVFKDSKKIANRASTPPVYRFFYRSRHMPHGKSPPEIRKSAPLDRREAQPQNHGRSAARKSPTTGPTDRTKTPNVAAHGLAPTDEEEAQTSPKAERPPHAAGPQKKTMRGSHAPHRRNRSEKRISSVPVRARSVLSCRAAPPAPSRNRPWRRAPPSLRSRT